MWKQYIGKVGLLAIVTLLGCGQVPQLGIETLEMTISIPAGSGNEGCVKETASIVRHRLLNHGLSENEFKITQNGNGLTVRAERLPSGQRVAKLLSQRGDLGFWVTYENSEIYPYLAQIDALLLEKGIGLDPTLPVKDGAEKVPSLIDKFGTDSLDALDDLYQQHPLFRVLNTSANNEGLFKGPVVGYVAEADKAKVMEYLTMEEAAVILPIDLKLMWTAKPINEADPDQVYQVVALKLRRQDGKPAMNGDAIEKASCEFGGPDGKSPEVTFQFDEEGARDWMILTRNNVGRSLAITMDDRVFSYPTVQGEIAGGRASITGNFSVEEAQDMANMLLAKAYPCPVEVTDVKISKLFSNNP